VGLPDSGEIMTPDFFGFDNTGSAGWTDGWTDRQTRSYRKDPRYVALA